MTPQLDIDVRFLSDDPAVDAVFRRWLEADCRAARLSPTFQTYYCIRSLIPLPVRKLLQRLRPVDASPR